MKKELEILYKPIERFGNLKKLSGELREVVNKKYPELREDEIEYLTQLLGMELNTLFLDINPCEKNSIFHRNYGTTERILNHKGTHLKIRENNYLLGLGGGVPVGFGLLPLVKLSPCGVGFGCVGLGLFIAITSFVKFNYYIFVRYF